MTPTRSRDATTQNDPAARNRELVRRHFAAINDHDLAAAAELHDSDVVVETAFGTREGLDEVLATWQAQLEAVPDLEDTIDELVATDDMVAVRYTTTGTLEGPLFGIEPAGESLEITSMAMLRVEDGQITEWLNHPNVAALLAQTDTVDLPLG